MTTKTASKDPELFAPEKEEPAPGSAQRRKTAVAKAEPKRAKATSTAVAVAQPMLPKSTMEIIKECAMDPRVDAGKMRELLTMAREEQNRIDERLFDLAKLEVQLEIPPITRDSFNDHTKSKWAKLEKISAIADPIIRRHGFSLSYGQDNCPIESHYRVTCEVTHTPTGFKKRYFMDVGMDSAGAKGGGTKSLAQGSGSSVQYAKRYLKVMIFDINVVGEDFDGSRFSIQPPTHSDADGAQPHESSKPKLSAEDVQNMRDKIKACGVGEDKFCKHFKIAKVEDLPPDLFDEATAACARYVRPKQ